MTQAYTGTDGELDLDGMEPLFPVVDDTEDDHTDIEDADLDTGAGE